MGDTIKDLHNDEKPREKILRYGPSILSETELLALILRTGNKNMSAIDLSREILNYFGALRGLANVEVGKLARFKGIGKAKASGIAAAMEIALRISQSPVQNKEKITKPEDIFNLVKKNLYNKEVEHLYLISLNSKNELISNDLISIGTVNETLIHCREIFRKALERNAVSLILVHNHPSGSPEPSNEDIQVTQRVLKAGLDIGIPLIDHIVTTNDSYISMKAHNLLKIKPKEGGDNKC